MKVIYVARNRPGKANRAREHYLFKRTWGGNHMVPISKPSLIVQWCCSTGIWSTEVALDHPKSRVIGIDYSSATLSCLSKTIKNFSFQHAVICDGHTGMETIEDNAVDFVMMRDVWLVNAPEKNWIDVLHEVSRILRPGGWIEVYELGEKVLYSATMPKLICYLYKDLEIQTVSSAPHLECFSEWFCCLLETIGIDGQTIWKIDRFLADTGFENLEHRTVGVPVGEWPAAPGTAMRTDAIPDRSNISKLAMKETGYLFKDLVERRFREAKRWICEFANVSEEEYLDTVAIALDECDSSKASMRLLYYAAQKPPISPS
ncbi:hypothetical protein DFQ30_008811 [Apophysomyces sp. BC1015]|nr:hypothetical protein DFQ30_008811 [Apophysomyces sp. BC1015]